MSQVLILAVLWAGHWTEEIGQVEQSTTTQSRDIVSSTAVKVYKDVLLADVSQ